MGSKRDLSLGRSGVGNIFVKNLDTSVDSKTLYDTFSLFGNLLSCKVATDENSESKGYGYVHYETAEAVNEAISKIDGMLIANKQVYVGHFVRRNDRAGQADWTNIYVGNVPVEWDEEKLRTEFGKFGAITSVVMHSSTSVDGTGGMAAVIAYQEHEAAVAALDFMHDKRVRFPAKDTAAAADSNKAAAAAAAAEPAADDETAAAAKTNEAATATDADTDAAAAKTDAEKKDGDASESATTAATTDETAAVAAGAAAEPEGPLETELFCCRAQKKSERSRELQQKYEAMKMERMSKYQGVNLYVKNLDEAVGEEALREAFAPHGTITSARIMKDAATGNSKGFGFVCFSSPEEATKAVQEINNKMIAAKPIYVAVAHDADIDKDIAVGSSSVLYVQALQLALPLSQIVHISDSVLLKFEKQQLAAADALSHPQRHLRLQVTSNTITIVMLAVMLGHWPLVRGTS
jgi:polyadenylate-binding protein